MSRSYVTDPDGEQRVMGQRETILTLMEHQITTAIRDFCEVARIDVDKEARPFIAKMREARITSIPQNKRHLYK